MGREIVASHLLGTTAGAKIGDIGQTVEIDESMHNG
jgi:hypothetical protein